MPNQPTFPLLTTNHKNIPNYFATFPPPTASIYYTQVKFNPLNTQHDRLAITYKKKGGVARLHLIARLKQRDEDALIEVMNTYGDYLLRTAYLLVKDHHLAEEAVQDTFITVFEKIHQLEDAAKLKSWLTTIIINRCRSHMRKSSWKNLLPTIDFNLFQLFKENRSSDNPEDFLLQWEGHQQLSAAIQQLDYKYRQVITLFYYNEMKITEIALHTHANESTVKSKLKRARTLLKDILLKGEESDEATTANHKSTAR